MSEKKRVRWRVILEIITEIGDASDIAEKVLEHREVPSGEVVRCDIIKLSV